MFLNRKNKVKLFALKDMQTLENMQLFNVHSRQGMIAIEKSFADLFDKSGYSSININSINGTYSLIWVDSKICWYVDAHDGAKFAIDSLWEVVEYLEEFEREDLVEFLSLNSDIDTLPDWVEIF